MSNKPDRIIEYKDHKDKIGKEIVVNNDAKKVSIRENKKLFPTSETIKKFLIKKRNELKENNGG